MAHKNYYSILGVSRFESTSGIRAAFRTLAKRYHPDHAGAGSTAAFLLIREAYDVLGDVAARDEYDRALLDEGARTTAVDSELSARAGRAAAPTPVRGWPAPEPLIPDRPLVNHSLLDMRLWPSRSAVMQRLARNHTGIGVPKAERSMAFDVEVVVSRDELERGGLIGIGVPVQLPCAACFGTGRDGPFDCEYCFGHGGYSDEQTVRIRLPARAGDGGVFEVPLGGLGIANTYLRIRVRLSRGGA